MSAESPENPDYRLKDTEKPYKDKELLRRLYWDEKMSTKEISEEFGCSSGTVSAWLNKHDIETRTAGETIRLKQTEKPLKLSLSTWGHVEIYHAHEAIAIHRIMAVAEWGFDAVCGMVVHHKNHIPWDNRIENLELLTSGEHTIHHSTKYDEEVQKEIADEYENTDKSTREVGDEYGVSNVTVLRYHRIHYDD